MRKKSLIFFVLVLLFLSCRSCAVSVKEYKWFDTRAYFLDLVRAQSPSGETAFSMIKRTKAIYGVNGSYFGRHFSDQGELQRFPIGLISFHRTDLTVCPAPPKRGYLWQTIKPGIGFEVPENPIFAIEAGPILLLDGKIIRSYQRFSKNHWNRKCLRTVVAIKENRVYFYKISGNLWDIAKYLQKQRVNSAINLDGGNSSNNNAKVVNAVVVFPKTRPFYAQFKSFYYLKW